MGFGNHELIKHVLLHKDDIIKVEIPKMDIFKVFFMFYNTCINSILVQEQYHW